MLIDAFLLFADLVLRERVLDSRNHASLFVLVHLAWPRDGYIFFFIPSAHILHQKNMKKWSSMTKIFALEFGELPFWILFFSFLPFFSILIQYALHSFSTYKRANKCNKRWFSYFFFSKAQKIHSKTNHSTLKAGVLLTILLKWRNQRRADMQSHQLSFFPIKIQASFHPSKLQHFNSQHMNLVSFFFPIDTDWAHQGHHSPFNNNEQNQVQY